MSKDIFITLLQAKSSSGAIYGLHAVYQHDNGRIIVRIGYFLLARTSQPAMSLVLKMAYTSFLFAGLRC